jgi:acyl CoA:acetate/3-ketoacid CoA transferase beta subunit
VNHPTSYWVPAHGPRVFVEQVDCVSGVGYDRADAAGATAVRFHHIHHVVSNKGVFDFGAPAHSVRSRAPPPGVTVDGVQELTSFELVVPDDVAESRVPTDEELRLIRDVLDPANARAAEVPDE